MTRALLITNPAAARTDPIAVEVVMATLRSAGWEAEVLATGGPGDAGRLAALASFPEAPATSSPGTCGFPPTRRARRRCWSAV